MILATRPARLTLPHLASSHHSPTAISFWQVFFPPALAATPSALSHITDPNTGATTNSTFTDLDDWLEFMKARGKPVSKDVWGLFVDFVRTIDPDYANYDEEGELSRSIDRSVLQTGSSHCPLERDADTLHPCRIACYRRLAFGD